MFESIFNFSVRYPFRVIVIFLLALAVFASQALKIQQDGRIEALISKDNEHILLRNQVESVFGSSNFIIVGIGQGEYANEKNSNTQGLLEQANSVSNALLAQQGVRDVHSIFNKQYLESGAGGFEVLDIIDSGTAAISAKDIFERLKSDPIYRGNLVSLDYRTLLLLVEFDPHTSDQDATEIVEKVLVNHKAESWPISGLPVIQHEIKRYMDRDMGVLIPCFFLALIILLYVSFRELRAVFVPLAPIVVSLVSTYGLMGALNIPITLVTNLVPMLLIAIGAAYAIHFFNQYYREQKEQPSANHQEQITATTSHIGRIVTLAAVTTLFGFISNIINPVAALREFALCLAFGVLILLVSQLTLLPSILSLLKKPRAVDQSKSLDFMNRGIDKLLNTLSYIVISHPKQILLVSGAVVFISALGVTQVKVESSGLSFFKENSQLVESSRSLSKNFGGVVGFDYVIDTGEADGAKNTKILNAISDFSTWIKSEHSKNVSVTLSLSDHLQQMGRTYNNDTNFSHFNSNDEIEQYLEVYSWGGNPEQDLRNMVDKDYRYLRISGRFSLVELENGTYYEESVQNQKRIIDAAQVWLNERLPSGIKAKPFGEIMIAAYVNESIIYGQILSLCLAIASVFLVTAFALRSIIAGLFCLLPVTMAVVVNFGVMSLFSIPLNIATALVSTMAIGIGIDDAIHFFMTYRKQFNKEQDYTESLTQTIQRSGRAIIYTTLALVGSYTIMLGSSFTPIIYFGTLNIITILFATFATLLTSSALLLVLKPKSLVQHNLPSVNNSVEPRSCVFKKELEI